MNMRRNLLFMLGVGALLSPRTLLAQQQESKKTHQIGFLTRKKDASVVTQIGAFHQKLHDLGWIEGNNIRIAYRDAEAMFHIASPPPIGMMAGSPLNGRDQLAWDHLPSGQMSLLDMINGAVILLCEGPSHTLDGTGLCWHRRNRLKTTLLLSSPKTIDEQLIFQLGLHYERMSEAFDLANSENRLGRIYTTIRLSPEISYAIIITELHILEQAIEDDIKTEYFYYYPQQRGLFVLRVSTDWQLNSVVPIGKGRDRSGG